MSRYTFVVNHVPCDIAFDKLEDCFAAGDFTADDIFGKNGCVKGELLILRLSDYMSNQLITVDSDEMRDMLKNLVLNYDELMRFCRRKHVEGCNVVFYHVGGGGNDKKKTYEVHFVYCGFFSLSDAHAGSMLVRNLRDLAVSSPEMPPPPPSLPPPPLPLVNVGDVVLRIPLIAHKVHHEACAGADVGYKRMVVIMSYFLDCIVCATDDFVAKPAPLTSVDEVATLHYMLFSVCMDDACAQYLCRLLLKYYHRKCVVGCNFVLPRLVGVPPVYLHCSNWHMFADMFRRQFEFVVADMRSTRKFMGSANNFFAAHLSQLRLFESAMRRQITQKNVIV